MSEKRPTQCERMERALSSGRWTPNEVFIEMRIPDYRRRMCDLREKYPHRYVSRERTRRRKDGSTYTMKDWRDVWATQDCLNDLLPQIALARDKDFEEDEPATSPIGFEYKGDMLYVTRGQLRLLNNIEVAIMLLERYIDPWRGEGVRE